MGIKFQVAGGSVLNPIVEAVRIVTVNTQAFYVGPNNTVGTLVVDTSTPQVSMNANLGGLFALRVTNINVVGASSSALELSAANAQGLTLTLAAVGAALTSATIQTTAAIPLNLGYNSVTVLQVTSSVAAPATGLSVSGAAAASGVTLTVTSSGANEDFRLLAKGAGFLRYTAAATALFIITGGTDRGGFQVQGGGGNSGEFGVAGTNGTPIAQISQFDTYINCSNGASSLVFAAGGVLVCKFVSATGLCAIGRGSGVPTYSLQIQPTSGATANQTMIIQDATAATGVTGIFFNAGANQGTTAILTVAGIIQAVTIRTSSTAFMHQTNGTLANGAGVGLGTMTNAPTAGDPSKWIPINDNGTTRYIPAWV